TIPNSSTTPSISSITVYDENLTPPTEWTCSTGSGAFNCGSTVNPYHLTKDVELTNSLTGTSVVFTNSGTLSLSSYSTLSFNIRAKAPAWSSAASVSICFL